MWKPPNRSKIPHISEDSALINLLTEECVFYSAESYQFLIAQQQLTCTSMLTHLDCPSNTELLIKQLCFLTGKP